MSTLRTLERAVDLAPGDHASWAYDDLYGLRAACVDTFDEGASRGEQLVYIGYRPLGELVEDLAGLESRDALLGSGQLEVHTVDGVSLDSAGLDTSARVETWRSRAEAAVASGYTGLRVVGDITEEIADAAHRRGLIECELAVDGMYAAAPAMALCVFDRRRAGSRWQEISSLHRIQHIAGQDPAFALTMSAGVVRLAGEVDTASADALSSLLKAVVGSTSGMLEVNLDDLAFIDVAASRVLARTHHTMQAQGRELFLTGVGRAAALPLGHFDLHRGVTT